MRHRPSAAESLLVLTKLPVPGRVKTRLAEETGDQRAADIHAKMVALTLRECALLAAADGTAVRVLVDGGPREARRAFGDRHGVSYGRQSDGDLGSRLERGFRDAFARGATRVCAIGTDCPDVDAALLRSAFSTLRGHDAVIGPAEDGGYYLIGLDARRADLLPALFRDVPWSTEGVADVTAVRLAEADAATAFLPALCDVDHACDLAHLDRVRHARTGPPQTISVIVAARDEEERIGPTLDRVVGRPGVEVTLVDGGSTDRTVEIARERGAAVLAGTGGRAGQYRAGAAIASGDALLFLHADTLLPERWDEEVRRILGDPEVVLGAFRFATDSPSHTLRLFERGTNLRARRGLPYGDQAHFLRATAYGSLGGVPTLPLMEDYELARRARRAGRVAISPHAAVTSARRWEEHGPWRWTTLNMATAVRYELGTSAEELVAWRSRVLGRGARGRGL